MLTKVTTPRTEEQHIYVGIDVHKKQYQVQILGEDHNRGPGFSQEASPERLVNYLTTHYPEASVHCVYEAGFCGFTLYRTLKQAGFDCIVVHAADVPSTDKEKRSKSDKIDARKLAMQLRSNVLTGIYVPAENILSLRNLIRVRKRLIKKRTSCKNQIKHFLFFNGINTPEELGHWSRRYMDWLSKLPLNRYDRLALDGYLQVLTNNEQIIKNLDRQLLQLSNEAPFKEQLSLLQSVPGIGLTTALVLLSEIADINRFREEKQLFSYVGLVPHVHASGEKEFVGGLTIRGNPWIKAMIIESAWQAITKDPALFTCYHQYKKRMNGNKAIIRIAKKLLSRIRHVMRSGEPYRLAVN
ncbi:MAG: IS110 family transposase [Cyclobacteriaceae bacterium]